MPKNKLTYEEISEAMAFADGGLGAAGHRVTDERARAIISASLTGKISKEEADRQLLELLKENY